MATKDEPKAAEGTVAKEDAEFEREKAADDEDTLEDEEKQPQGDVAVRESNGSAIRPYIVATRPTAGPKCKRHAPCTLRWAQTP